MLSTSLFRVSLPCKNRQFLPLISFFIIDDDDDKMIVMNNNYNTFEYPVNLTNPFEVKTNNIMIMMIIMIMIEAESNG